LKWAHRKREAMIRGLLSGSSKEEEIWKRRKGKME
jgi:hypothetical protein